jgi:hypothetical protein
MHSSGKIAGRGNANNIARINGQSSRLRCRDCLRTTVAILCKRTKAAEQEEGKCAQCFHVGSCYEILHVKLIIRLLIWWWYFGKVLGNKLALTTGLVKKQPNKLLLKLPTQQQVVFAVFRDYTAILQGVGFNFQTFSYSLTGQ